jgi:hypothetical protein
MRKEANIPTYVKLKSKEHLGIADARKWYKLVNQHAPQGIVASIPTIDINGQLTKTSLVRRSKEGATELIIPLMRDLLPNELQKLADAWRAISPSGSYSISTNPTQSQKLNQAVVGLEIDGDEYQSLCLQLAKVRHEGWMREKADAGWRYGPLLNVREKTHPLMRPWSDLPQQYKDTDTQNPEQFLKFLANQGYSVVRQEELISLAKILRDIS